MILLGIDLETTSVDVNTCLITEIGMVAWDTDWNQPIYQFGGLVQLPEGAIIPTEAAQISGITTARVKEWGDAWIDWEKQLSFLWDLSDGLVAHNHEFEKAVLARYLSSDTLKFDLVHDMWIDTMTDLPLPDRIVTRKLDYLCFEHGFSNPFPHRALTDVLSMFKILSLYSLEEVIRRASSPTIWLRANVTMETRHQAKAKSYWWDPTNKFWVKRIKRIFMEEEIEKSEFPVEVLQGYKFKEIYL